MSENKTPPPTNFWPSMRDRPYFHRIKDMMVQRESDSPNPGSRYVHIPNPDFEPAKYAEYEESLASYMRIPEERRGKSKPPQKPNPYPNKVMSDVDFKVLLVKHGVTVNPITNYDDVLGNKGESIPGSRAAKDKRVDKTALSLGPVDPVPLTEEEEEERLTRIKIYAREIYGIQPEDFTQEKFKHEAEVDLGIDKKAKLIPVYERKKNFELFKANHFADEFTSRFGASNIEPKMEGGVFEEIEKYALSSYGSLTIQKILNDPKDPKFLLGVSDSYKLRAGGKYNKNFILLPTKFPAAPFFAISKQEILGVAIIHHEIEHTKHGKFKNVDRDRDIMEEWRAVRYSENPVRIINRIEPRYIYYQNESGKTINILNSEEIKTGKCTFNKKDPSKEMIEVK